MTGLAWVVAAISLPLLVWLLVDAARNLRTARRTMRKTKRIMAETDQIIAAHDEILERLRRHHQNPG